MRDCWRYVVGSALVLVLVGGALAADALAHPDGCHRWHSCPSDDGGYVCGDLGHCSECPDNRYCLLGRSRSAAAAPPTRTPRPTQTPAPTHTPRPTQVPDAPRMPRAATASEPAVSRALNNSADATRQAADTGRAMPYSDPEGPSADALDDVRGMAAIAGTGAPLSAAPTPGGGSPSRAATPGDARTAPMVVAEYAGVRVVGPLQWSAEGESPTVMGAVHNAGAQVQTMVLTLFWLDARGQRLGTTEAVVWDLAPGESRPFAHAVPAQATASTDVSARLEPLVP